ncbi:MAG: hypothetical protein JNK82_34815 [Myxococcaceae bacterium]|nr:hypothetical protein [Myxococcaceae bacterium]
MLENDLRALKARMRSTPLPWPEPWHHQHSALKAQATLIYCARAHARGKLHLSKCTRAHARLGLPPMPVFTLDDQAKLLERAR